MKARAKQWSEANPERVRASRRRSYRKHLDKKREYHRDYGRKYRASNPDKNRRDHLKRKYGITDDTVTDLLRQQDGSCAICSVVLIRDPKAENGINIDHCHLTKKIRGLLCRSCNLGIGYLRDRADLVLAAADYLLEHG